MQLFYQHDHLLSLKIRHLKGGGQVINIVPDATFLLEHSCVCLIRVLRCKLAFLCIFGQNFRWNISEINCWNLSGDLVEPTLNHNILSVWLLFDPTLLLHLDAFRKSTECFFTFGGPRLWLRRPFVGMGSVSTLVSALEGRYWRRCSWESWRDWACDVSDVALLLFPW